MIEVLLEKNRNMYLEYFKLTKRELLFRRLKVMAVFFVLFGVIYYLYHDTKWLLFLFPLVLFVGYKLPYYELLRIKSKEGIIKEQMFPTFLRYFIALIGTQGNVYRTLRSVVPYMQEPIRSELIKLIKKIESENVENYDAFMDFADFIGSSEAYMIMGVVNQFNEEGINKRELNELENLVKNLQENKMNEIIEVKVNSVDKHANPILVYGLAYVILFTVALFMATFQNLPI